MDVTSRAQIDAETILERHWTDRLPVNSVAVAITMGIDSYWMTIGSHCSALTVKRNNERRIIGINQYESRSRQRFACAVARDNLSKSGYLVPALRPLRPSRTIDASSAGASSPESELDFSAPSRPIPGELPVLSMVLTPDFGTANFARFVAALRSLSTTTPQRWQMYSRSDRESLDFTSPHSEHVFDDGNHLSATTVVPPFHLVL